MSEWTTERFDLLKELAKAGSNTWIRNEINRRTGSTFTRSAIIGKKHRHGIGSRPNPGGNQGGPRRDRRKDGVGIRERKLNGKRPQMQRLETQKDLYFEGFLSISLVELQANDCRYPQGDGPYFFCGQPAIEGSSYCAYHHRLCHNGIPERPVKRNQGKLSVAWGGV